MPREIVIRPEIHPFQFDFRELWQYRELLYVLAWRDIRSRYAQTVLGIIWVVIQPLATTGIFSIIFGKIAKIPSDNLPYPLFIFAGLTIWNFFSNGLSAVSNSIASNGGLIQKVYFPRIIIPIAAIITSSVDFGINLILLFIAALAFGYVPSIQTLYVLPFLFLILVLLMTGVGAVAAAINTRYRDVRYVLPFVIQIGLYATPIIYPLSIIYDYKKYLLMVNPLTAITETTRALISNSPINWPLIFLSLVISVVIFLFGFSYFRKAEAYIADIL